MPDNEDVQDRSIERIEDWSERRRQRRYGRPAADVYSTESDVILLIDLPGVGKSDLDVTVEGGELLVEGRVPGREEEESSLPWGYERTFQLAPSIDRDRIRARLADGVLELKLGRRSRETRRHVEVE